MRKDLEYKGEPLQVIDIDGNKRYVDFEHMTNDKTKYARLVYKYKNKWYFNYMQGIGLLLINKENIKQVIKE
jgi:hypothetical protein